MSPIPLALLSGAASRRVDAQPEVFKAKATTSGFNRTEGSSADRRSFLGPIYPEDLASVVSPDSAMGKWLVDRVAATVSQVRSRIQKLRALRHGPTDPSLPLTAISPALAHRCGGALPVAFRLGGPLRRKAGLARQSPWGSASRRLSNPPFVISTCLALVSDLLLIREIIFFASSAFSVCDTCIG